MTSAWDATKWTKASYSADEALKVPTGLMSFASAGRGSPTNEQRYLYMSAVAFTYAVWENYVEELAIELTGVLADGLEPHQVPSNVQTLITKDASVWELSVEPGWRGLWRRRVQTLAKGSDSTWGLNTANAKNVRALFAASGMPEALPKNIDAPKDDKGKLLKSPAKIGTSPTGTVDAPNALSQLIEVRGQAVHTASTTDTLLKAEVLWWVDFVEGLYHETDKAARQLCRSLLVS